VLTTWQEVSADEVSQMAAVMKSGSLDPVPTFLLCIPTILQCLSESLGGDNSHRRRQL